MLLYRWIYLFTTVFCMFNTNFHVLLIAGRWSCPVGRPTQGGDAAEGNAVPGGLTATRAAGKHWAGAAVWTTASGCPWKVAGKAGCCGKSDEVFCAGLCWTWFYINLHFIKGMMGYMPAYVSSMETWLWLMTSNCLSFNSVLFRFSTINIIQSLCCLTCYEL